MYVESKASPFRSYTYISTVIHSSYSYRPPPPPFAAPPSLRRLSVTAPNSAVPGVTVTERLTDSVAVQSRLSGSQGQAFLELSTLPVRTDVASGNEDDSYCTSTQPQRRQNTSHGSPTSHSYGYTSFPSGRHVRTVMAGDNPSGNPA